jgi:hypothetical protein
LIECISPPILLLYKWIVALGRRRLVYCVRDDPLTTEGQSVANSMPSTYVLSVNAEMERLVGFSREEYACLHTCLLS